MFIKNKFYMIDMIKRKIEDTLESLISFEPVYPELVFGKDKRKFRRKVERKLKWKKKFGIK